MRLKTILLVGLLLFFPGKVFADSDFDIKTQSNYTVSESGSTRVVQNITITNKKEFIYTPSYTLTSSFKDISNVGAFSSDGGIKSSVADNNDGSKTIEVEFGRRVVGIGKSNQFSISFDTKEIAKKEGAIWEINIPGLSEPSDYLEYNVLLSVPPAFGKPTISKPFKNIAGSSSFRFAKDDIGKSGIYLLFGDSQFYKVDLTYHISNPNLFPVKTEIALPPDTSYQDTRIMNIRPRPSTVYEDEDGNWLAVYRLAPKQNQDIYVNSVVKLYSVPKITGKNALSYTSSEVYWEAGDNDIKKLAGELKTPEKIYDYVVKKLSYNYEKVSDDNIRLGAKKALLRPDYSVCLEFTDLFVAIARAAGIKARSVEGFAYTENSKLRPVSLVKDILHAWPEYYSEAENKWIMVDPTWGNTTNGMDYFNSFDFDHIAFVVKGKSSNYPVPAGGYKFEKESKDVNVSFATRDSFYDSKSLAFESELPQNVFSFFSAEGYINVTNNGNYRYSGGSLGIRSVLFGGVKSYEVPPIPPYGSQKILVSFPKTKILTNEVYNATILFEGSTLEKQIRISIIPELIWIVLGGGIFVASTIISITAVKTWRIYLQKR